MGEGDEVLVILGRAGLTVVKFCWVVLATSALATVLILAVFAVSETRVGLPAPARLFVERHAEQRLPGAEVALGGVEVGLSRQFVPHLWLNDLTVSEDAQPVVRLGEIGLSFAPRAALEGRAAPLTLRVSGADLILRRDVDGRFELDFGGGGSAFRVDGPAALLDAAEALFDRPPLERVNEVSFEQVGIVLSDARARRIWRVEEGSARLTRDPGGLSLTLDAGLAGAGTAAAFSLAVETDAGSSAARLRTRLDGVAASDLALQSPVLSVFSVLDAPLSGALSGALDPDGEIAALDASLSIGAGRLRQPRSETPRPRARSAPPQPPLVFDSALAELSYDPGRARLMIDTLTVETDRGRARLGGHVDLKEPGQGGFPAALTAILTAEALDLDAPSLFDGPLALAGTTAELTLRRDPAELVVDRVTLPGPGAAISATGRIAFRSTGPTGRLEVTAASLRPERVISVWPKTIAPGARRWVTERLIDAVARDVVLTLDLDPGRPRPEAEIRLAFAEGSATPTAFLPALTGAAGTFTLAGQRMRVDLDRGWIAPEGAAPVDLAGSAFVIPDTTPGIGRGEVELAADGPLAPMLALIDLPPLSLLSKAGLSPQIATGRATVSGRLGLPIGPDREGKPVHIDVAATATDLVSSRLVPGRTLAADRLDLAIADRELSIEGDVTLDGIPADIRFRQPFGPAGAETGPRPAGQVIAETVLSAETMAGFGLKLPPGWITGKATAEVRIDLPPGDVPELTLTSTLAGLGLEIAPLDWAKVPADAGRLRVSGDLGGASRVIRLEVRAPALFARGRVGLDPDGYDAVTFDRVTLGDWLDAPVKISNRGEGLPPGIRVEGGRIDLARAPFLSAGAPGAAEPPPDALTPLRGPIAILPDRLEIVPGIVLSPAIVEIAPGRILQGRFEGQINRGARITGEITPGPGTAPLITISAGDAGRALADTGLFPGTEGGSLDLRLRPVPGGLAGNLAIAELAVLRAPLVTTLLNAASVVGIVDQFAGDGLLFDDIDAEFTFLGGTLTLYQAAATGAALGLSVDGRVDTEARELDIQGVLSPIYVLNRVGSLLTRRGEGLVGATFALTGPLSEPQVRINPLSLATPGLFREIFRRPTPDRP